ncbi:hypothetical protein RND81_04G134100 [Saponaria officinalis]|uniref:Uncharacterized protein n=1 Tax=Saponaria officinalis TaxID=3572 RepID=A0AAW1LKS3_SAPOF
MKYRSALCLPFYDELRRLNIIKSRSCLVHTNRMCPIFPINLVTNTIHRSHVQICYDVHKSLFLSSVGFTNKLNRNSEEVDKERSRLIIRPFLDVVTLSVS